MTPTLRFVLCGSVDDGKSTLIGRILYDCRQVFADQLRSVEADSRRYGTQGDATDLALLVDGLQDEREQGITIDVAYRAFDQCRGLGGFILIDRVTQATVGAGTITFALMRAANLEWQDFDCHPASPRRTQAAARPLPVADRPFGVGQVHGRQPPGEAPRLGGAPHLPAGWRQRPPRSQPGPGLYRDRPR